MCEQLVIGISFGNAFLYSVKVRSDFQNQDSSTVVIKVKQTNKGKRNPNLKTMHKANK